MSYRPQPNPKNPTLQRELQRLAVAVNAVHDFEVLTAPPKVLTVGMVRYADGSSWNPGSGEGLYVYTSSGWAKL